MSKVKVLIVVLAVCSIMIKCPISMAEKSDQYILEKLISEGHKPLTQQGFLNIETYKKYTIVAYGMPFGACYSTFNTEGENHEFRYLGYNVRGVEITNDYFPGDFAITIDSRNRNYVNLGEQALASWNGLSEYQISRLLYDDMYNDDYSANPMPYTLAEQLGNVAKTETEMMEYVIVLVAPTKYQKGVVKIFHKVNGAMLSNTYER